MDIKEYAEKIASKIENASVKVVEKNNGCKLTGITIKKEGDNISPNIYIDGMYEEGKSIEEAVEYIKKTYEEYKLPNMDYNFLKNYEEIKPRLTAKLLNAEKNKYIGMNAKKFGFEDLIIVPYINVEDIISGAEIRVTEEIIKNWNKEIEEIVKEALNNIKEDVEIMDLSEITPFAPFSPIEMLIVSNKKKRFGAIASIFAIGNIKNRYPKGIKLIPSSVHEVIIIPKISDDEENLNRIINDVNSSCVAAEEFLSNHSYEFV